MRQKSKPVGVQLNCFSPPVMLTSLFIETFLIVYTLWRYRMTELSRLVVTMLVALAAFQLSEYQVCTGFGPQLEDWSRLGFSAITLLPALGLHVQHVLAAKPGRRLVVGSYVIMGGFIVFFLIYHAAFIGHQCTGNYVIFQLGHRPTFAYGVYYYGWLFVTMALGIKWASELRDRGQKLFGQLQSVRGLIVGYLVFLVPTALANFVRPETRRGIPSIMCGFAVLFALILTLYILPRRAEAKSTFKLFSKS